jgi:polysaccharide lyase-like protein
MFKPVLVSISLLLFPAAAAAAAAAGQSDRTPADALSLVGATATARLKFSCTFAASPADCGFRLQAKAPGRASLANSGRAGGRGLRLRTEPGDYNIAGSGDMERTDVYLSQTDTGCDEGREQVWEHSILFPDDFAMPTWQMYVLFDFHHTGPGGQANFHVNFADGALVFRGFGGRSVNDGHYQAKIGPAMKNVWYDFVYHVKWSSSSDGFFHAWVNGVKKLAHHGPTLYAGLGCYLKLANYHTPVCNPYPGCTGPASSVIHDRIIRYDVIP